MNDLDLPHLPWRRLAIQGKFSAPPAVGPMSCSLHHLGAREGARAALFGSFRWTAFSRNGLKTPTPPNTLTFADIAPIGRFSSAYIHEPDALNAKFS